MTAKASRFSRRGFLAASGGSAAALANPGLAAARAVGAKPGELPDLTIREVRVYNLDLSVQVALIPASRNWRASSRTAASKATILSEEGTGIPIGAIWAGSNTPSLPCSERASSIFRRSHRNGSRNCTASGSFPMRRPSTIVFGMY